jgi:YVTN family beta-propeller protein
MTGEKSSGYLFMGMRVIVAAAVLGGNCAGQGKTPSPALIVLNKSASELAIVDPGTLQVVSKVPTGPIPHEVAVSDDGKIAVTTNYGENRDGTTLSVIDLDTQKEIHRVDISPLRGPHGIVATRDGKFRFTAEGSNSIASYDPVKNEAGGWTLPTSQNRTHMLVEARDNLLIFTANIGSNSVTAFQFNPKQGTWSTTQIAVSKGPEGIDMSPDEKEVWAANSGDGTVSIIDVASKKVVGTIDLKTKRSNRVKFTPDGKLVLISDLGAGDLVIVDAASRKEIKRLHLGKSAEGILIVPDGARAFVAVSGDDKVAVLDLKTLEVAATVATGQDPDGLAWRK